MKSFVVSISFVLSFVVFGQNCNDVQTLSSNQKNSISLLLSQLNTSLIQEYWSSVDSLSLLLKSTFGQEGGKPDSKESFYPLSTSTQWLNIDETLTLARQLIDKDSSIYSNLWQVAQGISPIYKQPHSIFLRSAAEIAAGLYQLAVVETDIKQKNKYITWANRALDTLATKQLPDGAYPFPDLRSTNDPTFTPIINNYLSTLGKDSLKVLKNGWIIDDHNRGDFKFDAGVIANSYYLAYRYTNIERYKENVLRIADYCLPLPMSANYNYNTFASLALTRGYELNQKKLYLDRTETTLRYSVIPGQLTNGRWMDGHNANSRYHNLLIYNTVPTLLQLKQNTKYVDSIKAMVRKAVLNQLNYTSSCGSTTGFRWLVSAFTIDSTIFSPNEYLSLKNLLGNYMQQAKSNGKYIDIPSMGAYIELLNQPKTSNLTSNGIEKSFVIYPNPAQNTCTIQSSFPINLSDLTLCDLFGNQIELESLVSTKNHENKIEFTTEKLSAGVYLLNSKHASEVKSVRLQLFK